MILLMDDIIRLILSILSTRDFLMMRQINKHFDDLVCNNKTNKERMITITKDHLKDKSMITSPVHNLCYKLDMHDFDDVYDNDICDFCDIRWLRTPDFDWSNITDDGIKKLTNITHLDLDFNEYITNEGISALTNLRFLDLSGNDNITNIVLKNFTKLETLILDFNSSIKRIEIDSITELHLEHNYGINDQNLIGLTKLRSLVLVSNFA